MGSMTDPVLVEVPEEIATPRLLLRSPRPGDGAAVHEAVAESVGRLRPWLSWAWEEPSREASERYTRQARARFDLRQALDFYGYLRRDPSRLALVVGLHTIDWSVPRFELGYWVRTAHEGQGLVREAVGAVTAMAFDRLGAQRVEIRCDAENARSAAVAHALGFVLEGRLRRHRRDGQGSVRDTLLFARVREDA